MVVSRRHAVPSELLTTSEAAAYCGYETTGGLRKAIFDGRLRAAGRRGGGGPCVFDMQELERFQRSREREDRPESKGARGVEGGRADREAVDVAGIQHLVTADAAAYCGYRSACSLRKAAHAKQVWPVGRISTNGPNVWLVSDLQVFLRGERPPSRDGSRTFMRGAVPRVADLRARTERVPVIEETAKDDERVGAAANPHEAPRLSARSRAPGRIDLRRSYTTRQVAAWYAVSVEHVREWVRRHSVWNGRCFVASFRQMIALRERGGRWQFYMRVGGGRSGTSRPPAAEARRRVRLRRPR